MIDGVAARRLTGHLLVENAKVFGDASRGLSVAAQPQKSRVKGWHILGEKLSSIALGVYRNENDLDIGGRLRAECTHNLAHLSHSARTDIGAVRKTKKHHDQTTAKIRQATHYAMVVSQLEVFCKVGPCDVGIPKKRAIRTGRQQRQGTQRDTGANQRTPLERNGHQRR